MKAQRKPDNSFPQGSSERQPIRENTFIEPIVFPFFFSSAKQEKKWLSELQKEILTTWDDQNKI